MYNLQCPNTGKLSGGLSIFTKKYHISEQIDALSNLTLYETRSLHIVAKQTQKYHYL